MIAVITKPGLVLGPKLNGMRMTPSEFDAVRRYNKNYTYELVHGVLVVNPIPLESEAGPNDWLGYLFYSYRELHPKGLVLDVSLPERYIATKDSRRRCDRLVWTGLGRIPDWKRELPRIAIEFVSKRSRDRV